MDWKERSAGRAKGRTLDLVDTPDSPESDSELEDNGEEVAIVNNNSNNGSKRRRTSGL